MRMISGETGRKLMNPNMTDQDLLQTLIELHDGGLTQAQAADLLGMSQPGINNVLAGKSRLSRTGRAFVEHLLRDGERLAAMPPLPNAAEWARELYRIAREIEAVEQLLPKHVSDAYQV